MQRRALERRVRSVCLSFPQATERLSHGSPAFFVGKQFVALWSGGHHEHDFPHLWCAAPPGAQEAAVVEDPARYFRPPYVGGRGWIGMRLDGELDDEELATVLEEAYCAVAPKRLVNELAAGRDGTTGSR